MRIESHGTVVRIIIKSGVGVADRYRAHRNRHAGGEPHIRGVYEKLDAAGDDAEKVAEAIGNKSWTHPWCDSCEEHVDRAWRVTDREGGPVSVCVRCLKAALAVLEQS